MKEDLVYMTREWVEEQRREIETLKLMRSKKVTDALSGIIGAVCIAVFISSLFLVAVEPGTLPAAIVAWIVCMIGLFTAVKLS